jgi:hypothetical protein
MPANKLLVVAGHRKTRCWQPRGLYDVVRRWSCVDGVASLSVTCCSLYISSQMALRVAYQPTAVTLQTTVCLDKFISTAFTEQKRLLLCSQESATDRYPEPDESNQYRYRPNLFYKIHFTIIIPSTPRSAPWSLQFSLSNIILLAYLA